MIMGIAAVGELEWELGIYIFLSFPKYLNVLIEKWTPAFYLELHDSQLSALHFGGAWQRAD